jgi:serine/threonine protein kinase/tetratricopeptide (TPR) repeat protein
MTPERWQQIKGVLQEALEVPAEKRTSFLDTACRDDLSLRKEVESLLLEESETDEAFLQSPVNLNLTDVEREGASWVGRRIGSYEIIEEIGEGGMGSVYRAARADEQYQKQVAIKIVKLGLDTPFALARFRAERQILANLEHPNIARLLDGGTTENGLPYVVMELVEGQPIDEYCNTHKLSVEERLRLFRKVCLAVQYAHQHLVVHRDLKPGNILVTADGTPKLLDFGIAKILDTASFPGGAEPTVSFMRMLTPEYASPEQIRGETVTTESDIYSLGVILFLLLTGQHPYPFDSRSADAIVRAICDTEPRKPSTAVRKTTETTAGQQPTQRDKDISTGESSVKLGKRLRGDLDNIVLLALRKDPQRRYASAEQFAEDIRRHLESLPVVARNDTVGYRIGKFVTRHRTGTAATAVAAMFLVAAFCVALYEARVARQQAEVARQQRARAEKRFNDVRKLANSLIFEIHDSIRDLSGATEARALLVTRALEYLDSLSHETGDPGLQRELAAAYDRIGDVQGYEGAANLGDYSGAAQSYAKALAIREALAAANPADQQLRGELADEYFRVASTFQNVGDFAAALRVLQRAQAFVSDPANTMDNRQRSFRLAGIYYYTARALEGTGDFPNALHNYQQAAAAMEPIAADPKSGSLPRAYLAAHYLGIGKMQGELGRYTEAVANVAKGRDMVQQLSLTAPTNATLREYLADSYTISGNVLQAKGELKESLRYLQQARAIYKQLAAADPNNKMANANVGWGNLNVADNLLLQGQVDEAMPLIRDGLAIFEKINMQKGFWYAVQLGQSYLDLGKAWAEKAKRASSSASSQQMWRNALAADQKALAIRSVNSTVFNGNGHDQMAEIHHQIDEANAALSPAGAAKSSEEAAKK